MAKGGYLKVDMESGEILKGFEGLNENAINELELLVFQRAEAEHASILEET